MNTLDLFTLTGKTAVVTGGSGHLGRAMVSALKDGGASVYVAGTSHDKFISVFGESTDLQFVKIDIMNTQSIKDAFASVSSQSGGVIDILVNCAAQYAGIGKKSEDLTDEEWDKCYEGIAGSTYKCIREVLPYMKEGGSIINIGSMYGKVVPHLSVYDTPCESSMIPVTYCAGKASVIDLTENLGHSLIGRGIRVNCISPGPFPATTVNEVNELAKRLRERSPSKRLGEPDELRGAVLFLASDASKFVVGQNIQVDGGWTLW